MVIKFLTLTIVLVSLLSCNDEETILPDNTAGGILTIDDINYRVNYATIWHTRPDGNNLHRYSITLSDYPIDQVESSQNYSSPDRSFSISISFLSFDNTLKAQEYQFWQSEVNPEPYWWIIDQIRIKNRYLNHPSSGKIFISELDGTYSFIMNLNTDSDLSLAKIQGTAFSQFNNIDE